MVNVAQVSDEAPLLLCSSAPLLCREFRLNERDILLLVMTCSFFVQAGEGSTFAIVPLVKRRVTGQIAGNVGAYGNVGAVAYLTIFSLLPEWLSGGGEQTTAVIAQSNTVFFQMMGIAALIVAFLCWFVLKEPEGSFADHHEGEDEYSDLVIEPKRANS